MNDLNLLGVSHRTAPVSWRERLAVPDEKVPEFLNAVCLKAGALEAVALSTCNRVEIYAVTPPDRRGDLRRALVEWHGDAALAGGLYALEHTDAVRHLFRVAAGLDSLVVGENEILGQVKRSYDVARQGDFTGKLTNVLFQRAMFVGKSVRNETKIGEGPTSVPSLAVSLARRIFGDLAESRVLVVGAGAMAELALRALRSQKARHVEITNRTFEKAAAMADLMEASAVPFDRRGERLAEADIVVCSTGSPVPLFSRADVEAAMGRRRGRPLFFIDIAVPRDVDPAVNDVDDVYLYNIDDLESIVAESRARRESDIALADRLVDEKAREFRPWYESWRRGESAALKHGAL